MTESTVCQMDEDYKQKANAVWRKRGEIEGEDPEAYSPSGRYPYKWFIDMETQVSYSRRYRGWAQNEEYLQAGIVFMQERMASAFYFESTPPPVEEWDFVAMNNFKGDIAMIFKSGKYKIAPMFVGNTFFMSSE